MPLRTRNYDAMKSLLEAQYPRAYRIAAALCGDVRLARAVTRDVLRQGLRVLDRSRSDDAAAASRWFAHHTVLTARQAIAGQQVDLANDALLPLSADPVFTTILRTLRFIPPQQREAFLLHHGEKFDLRQLATAMDCSAEAAANHLVAATEALRPIAHDRLGEFTATLPQLLARLLPPQETIAVESRRVTSRYLWPRRLKRYVGVPLLVIALAVTAYYAWRLWQMLVV